MKNLKNIKAFTIIELLIVMVILGVLLLIVPNLELFVENAVKKEGVLLVRTIIEQERIYKADNGKFFLFNKGSNNYKKIQEWKTIKTLLIDNKYFRPEKLAGAEIKTDLTEQVITFVKDSDLDSIHIKQNNEKIALEVEIKASDYSKVKNWKIRGFLIEKKDEKPEIKFQDSKDDTNWQEIVL